MISTQFYRMSSAFDSYHNITTFYTSMSLTTVIINTRPLSKNTFGTRYNYLTAINKLTIHHDSIVIIADVTFRDYELTQCHNTTLNKFECEVDENDLPQSRI